MSRQVVAWALAGLVASVAPRAFGQSAASDDKADGGVAETTSRPVRNKDAPSDVRALDPARATPGEENTRTAAPATKQRNDSSNPAPSDVRALDPAGKPPRAHSNAREGSDAKKQKDSPNAAPSDVRALDPTREVPSEENKGTQPAEPGK